MKKSRKDDRNPCNLVELLFCSDHNSNYHLFSFIMSDEVIFLKLHFLMRKQSQRGWVNCSISQKVSFSLGVSHPKAQATATPWHVALLPSSLTLAVDLIRGTKACAPSSPVTPASLKSASSGLTVLVNTWDLFYPPNLLLTVFYDVEIWVGTGILFLSLKICRLAYITIL